MYGLKAMKFILLAVKPMQKFDLLLFWSCFGPNTPAAQVTPTTAIIKQFLHFGKINSRKLVTKTFSYFIKINLKDFGHNWVRYISIKSQLIAKSPFEKKNWI